MGKKDSLEDLLDMLKPESGKDGIKKTPSASPEKPVVKAPHARKRSNGSILSPLMDSFTLDQKFEFISSLMDFTGDFLIKLIDHYSLELSKIENSISVIQSSTLNQIRSTRTQIIKARQEGLLEKPKGPKITTGRQVSMAVATQGAPTKGGRHQPTKKDVQNIALEIRQLIKRQKESKSTPEIMGIKIDDLKGRSLRDIKKSSIESKLAEYKKSQTEQEERLKKKVKKTAKGKKSTKKGSKKKSTTKKKAKSSTAKPLPASFKKNLISNIKVKLKDLDNDKEGDEEKGEETQEE